MNEQIVIAPIEWDWNRRNMYIRLHVFDIHMRLK